MDYFRRNRQGRQRPQLCSTTAITRGRLSNLDQDSVWGHTETLETEEGSAGKTEFVPVAVHVIERSNSWVERCQESGKNFEWTRLSMQNKSSMPALSSDGWSS